MLSPFVQKGLHFKTCNFNLPYVSSKSTLGADPTFSHFTTYREFLKSNITQEETAHEFAEAQSLSLEFPIVASVAQPLENTDAL